MSAPLKGIGAITLFVEDLERSRSFYQDVFGLKPIYEDDDSTVFDFDNTIVNLLRVAAARTLIEPASVAGPDAGSRFQLTIWVKDADAASAALDARGVTLLNGPIDREWGVRTASFTDLDGTIWEIAQQLS
ncbi:MAG TPA: VOC family protein [Actinomycetota bacterium]|jgi:catechol 2,3-dioxygenase-like lactoylglutathione lyase family enzyme|nr:VOC family protein [Actinomycetota bacterium]